MIDIAWKTDFLDDGFYLIFAMVLVVLIYVAVDLINSLWRQRIAPITIKYNLIGPLLLDAILQTCKQLAKNASETPNIDGLVVFFLQ